MDPQYLNLSLRTVYLIGEVNEGMAARFIPAIELLDSTDGPIRIVIDSEGGSENDGYAIYDAITMCRNTVTADVYGQCMSIAAAIFQAADIRRMSPSADLMIHHGTTEVGETVNQDLVVSMADQIKRDNQRYYAILASGSHQAVEVIEDWCREEKYFSALEAVDCGFCDEVMEPLRKHAVRPKKKRKKRDA